MIRSTQMISTQNELNVMNPVALNKTTKKRLFTVNMTLLMLMLISHMKRATKKIYKIHTIQSYKTLYFISIY